MPSKNMVEPHKIKKNMEKIEKTGGIFLFLTELFYVLFVVAALKNSMNLASALFATAGACSFLTLLCWGLLFFGKRSRGY